MKGKKKRNEKKCCLFWALGTLRNDEIIRHIKVDMDSKGIWDNEMG